MNLSTDEYRLQREFHILLASSVLILGMYGLQDIFFASTVSEKNIEIFQLETTTNSTPAMAFNENKVEFSGVVAYNQNTNLFILQTTNGAEYVITSKFANFLELVGTSVTIGGNLSGTTIEVNQVSVL